MFCFRSPVACATNMVERLSTACTSLKECVGPKGAASLKISWYSFSVLGITCIVSVVLSTLPSLLVPVALGVISWKAGMVFAKEGSHVHSLMERLAFGLSQSVNGLLLQLPNESRVRKDLSWAASKLGTYLMSKSWVKLEGGLDKKQAVKEMLMIFIVAETIRFVVAQVLTVFVVASPALYTFSVFWGGYGLINFMSLVCDAFLMPFLSSIKEKFGDFVEIQKEKLEQFITSAKERLKTFTTETMKALDVRIAGSVVAKR